MLDTFPYLRRFKNISDGKKQKLLDTKIVVASIDHEIISDFREIQNNAYITNISREEHWPYYNEFDPLHVKAIGFGSEFIDEFKGDKFKKMNDLSKNAFQTAGALITKELVAEVRKHHGSIYAFLTEFIGISELEPLDGHGIGSDDYYRDLLVLLNKGIDGVMTDYPSIVYQYFKVLGLRV